MFLVLEEILVDSMAKMPYSTKIYINHYERGENIQNKTLINKTL